MNINSDINVLGGLPDWNLIILFMNDSMHSLNQNAGHQSYTGIKTTKALKEFERVINNTFLTFKNEDLRQLVRSILLEESISPDSLLMIFWNASTNNELLNYINDSVYFPAFYSGRVAIRPLEIVACLKELKQTEQDIQKWSVSTIENTGSKYLTLLKKLNLLEGSINKTIVHPYLNDKMFVFFVFWLLSVEQKTNILESPWLKYCFSEKQYFIERILQKKFSNYFNLNYSGDKIKIETLIPYENIYHAIR